MSTHSQELPLEERAKKLLLFKINRKGEMPNPFTDMGRIAEEIQFLLDKGYVKQTGETPKSLDYHVTSKGRKYALN